jgi:hypothetical protein
MIQINGIQIVLGPLRVGLGEERIDNRSRQNTTE